MGTDRDWQRWGEQDPYFGVLSSEDFRKSNLSQENRADFFRSGEAHIEDVFARIRDHVWPAFNPSRTLDFGCGVGRLLIPLAKRSLEATGVDVAESMLAEARANCDAVGIGNARFVRSDATMSGLVGGYDLMHSALVFQHIPTERGLRLLGELLKHLAPGGVVALQFFYRADAPKWVRGLVKLRYRVPLLNNLRNILRGRPLREPAMQLHCYDLDALVDAFQRAGIPSVYLEAYEAFGFKGAMIYGRRSGSK